jgi:apolipoprotein D and lipocalin family protein
MQLPKLGADRTFLLRKTGIGVLAGAAAFATGALLLRKRHESASGNPSVPDPIRRVDLARYMGRWYEYGRYEQRFEANCENVTADYALRADGLVNIINTCRDADGRVSRIAMGRAKPVDASNPSKLKVSFLGPFYTGNYWILDHADDYAWSIVGDPTGRFLWILGREPTPSPEIYAELVSHAQSMGFDMSMFRRTTQTANAT